MQEALPLKWYTGSSSGKERICNCVRRVMGTVVYIPYNFILGCHKPSTYIKIAVNKTLAEKKTNI